MQHALEGNDIPAVALRSVAVKFGNYTAVKDVTFDVAAGEFVSLVGPTGCGKSTLLNVVTGLTRPSVGTIDVFGEQLRTLNSHAGYMLQQDALLPWKSALDNVALGLIFRGMSNSEARSHAAIWLKKVGLEGFEKRYPHQLSGGMKKRVAMAQVFILRPKIILLDEPFSALDVHTRHLMQAELLRLWEERDASVVFITHDLEEAITLADRVVVMAAGPASHPIGSFPVSLARPRNISDMVLDDEFRSIYAKIWSVLKTEVNKSYARADA